MMVFPSVRFGLLGPGESEPEVLGPCLGTLGHEQMIEVDAVLDAFRKLERINPTGYRLVTVPWEDCWSDEEWVQFGTENPWEESDVMELTDLGLREVGE